MTQQLTALFVSALIVAATALTGCKGEQQDSAEQESAATEAEQETIEHPSEDSEPAAEAEQAPTVEERREALLEKERREAQAEVTADNADQVASELEKEIDRDLAELENDE